MKSCDVNGEMLLQIKYLKSMKLAREFQIKNIFKVLSYWDLRFTRTLILLDDSKVVKS